MLPIGHCRNDGWCWVFPTPVGNITGVYVASPTTTYVAAERDLFRVGPDGGLIFDQTLLVSASYFEQTPAGLWVSGESGIARIGAATTASLAGGMRLMASSAGGLWALSSGEIQRYNGSTFQTVNMPGFCSMASFAAVGPNLLRHCKLGFFSSTLDEITPAGGVTTRSIDAGDLSGIAGRSAASLVANGFLPGSGFPVLVRLDVQGNLSPLLMPSSLAAARLLEMGADENTVWLDNRSSVFDLGAGNQADYLFPPLPFFSAGFGKVISASSTRVLIPETSGSGQDLLNPPALEVSSGGPASGWFLDGLSVLSCPPRVIVEPETEFIPNPIDIAQHPGTGERLVVTSVSIARADGGSLPAITGNLRPSRLLPFNQQSWLALGTTSGLSWSWVFDGVGWTQVLLPTTPDAGLIRGVSASDAGIYVTTGAALLSFDGTGWTSQTPPPTGGPLTTVCSLGPLLLIERNTGTSRTLQEYRRGTGFGIARTVPNTHRLACSGQRVFDVQRFSAGTLVEYLSDGGQSTQPAPFQVLDLEVDNQGREYLFGSSCSVVRRGP